MTNCSNFMHGAISGLCPHRDRMRRFENVTRTSIIHAFDNISATKKDMNLKIGLNDL